MNSDRGDADWQHSVRVFAEHLEEQEGYSSVKELCRFLLNPFTWKGGQRRPYTWRDASEPLQYLQDYIAMSRAHHAFHERWSHLGNMRACAEYDKREMEKIGELIGSLEHGA